MDRYDVYEVIVWFGLFFIISISFIIGLSQGYKMKLQAIERGYAIYCPVDGEFAWVGECKETKDE